MLCPSKSKTKLANGRKIWLSRFWKWKNDKVYIIFELDKLGSYFSLSLYLCFFDFITTSVCIRQLRIASFLRVQSKWRIGKGITEKKNRRQLEINGLKVCICVSHTEWICKPINHPRWLPISFDINFFSYAKWHDKYGCRSNIIICVVCERLYVINA